jgi:hypothetical protein
MTFQKKSVFQKYARAVAGIGRSAVARHRSSGALTVAQWRGPGVEPGFPTVFSSDPARWARLQRERAAARRPHSNVRHSLDAQGLHDGLCSDFGATTSQLLQYHRFRG